MNIVAIKKILIIAINSQQINYSIADAIATAAGFDLTEVIDPVKTAADLIHIGKQLQQSGVIDEITANSYRSVADSIFGHLDKFEAA